MAELKQSSTVIPRSPQELVKEFAGHLSAGTEVPAELSRRLRETFSQLPSREQNEMKNRVASATLSGLDDVGGKSAGIEIFHTLFGAHEALVLSHMVQLTRAMNVVVRDFYPSTKVEVLRRFSAWRRSGNLSSLPETKAEELRKIEKHLFGILKADLKGKEAFRLHLLKEIEQQDPALRKDAVELFAPRNAADLTEMTNAYRETWEWFRTVTPFEQAEDAVRTILRAHEEIQIATQEVKAGKVLPEADVSERWIQASTFRIAAKRAAEQAEDHRTQKHARKKKKNPVLTRFHNALEELAGISAASAVDDHEKQQIFARLAEVQNPGGILRKLYRDRKLSQEECTRLWRTLPRALQKGEEHNAPTRKLLKFADALDREAEYIQGGG